MHQQATADLAATKASLAKSEEARVRAEVRAPAALAPWVCRRPAPPAHPSTRPARVRPHAALTPPPRFPRAPRPQGRLPEIDVLQGQLTAAHEELSDAKFRAEEQRSAAAAREQQVSFLAGFRRAPFRALSAVCAAPRCLLGHCRRPGPTLRRSCRPCARPPPPPTQLASDKLALEQQASALTASSQRLERELAAAGAKAAQQEAQLAEIYELCTSQQGARAAPRAGVHKARRCCFTSRASQGGATFGKPSVPSPLTPRPLRLRPSAPPAAPQASCSR
jgi:hypothetical protein